MKRTALLFPGQGSQIQGMLDLCSKDILIKSSEILGYDLLKISNDEQRLNQTKYTQPAIFVTSYYGYKKNKNNLSDTAYLIGHSLGEWTAAVVSGVLGFEQGLKAVSKRAQFMDESKNGAMAAVLGMESSEIEKEIQKYDDLVIANYNLPSQTVISGSSDSLDDFSSNTEAKVIKLHVSGAFHSPLMEEARSKFLSALNDSEFNDASIPIILNSTAEPETAGDAIKNSLINQLTKPVYFYQSISYALDNGINQFLEIGPSKVLTNLVNKLRKEL